MIKSLMVYGSERMRSWSLEGAGIQAARYQVHNTIARGGMGEVSRATDTLTGQPVALKRLLDKGARPDLRALFQLEYETLARIRHPRIIEVFDYGVDADGPFYTMELLDGSDLQSLGKQSYRTACKYLRDVATSLALLHTRRIVHRDLSPKNVRLTGDGRCKLIDFGAMGFVGTSSHPVGTPPMLAPETFSMAPLDHRADLFALGALAYWMLTGRHAYPAAQISELEGVWQHPPSRPSAWCSEVPLRLDELVMSLLRLDPNGRPPSAAYVIEVLSSVAGLPVERGLDDAQSYVAVPALVGREREKLRMSELLGSLSEGQGSGLLIESNPGIGRTRLLEELSLAASLSGIQVAEVRAEGLRGTLGLAKALLKPLTIAGGADAANLVVRRGGDFAPIMPVVTGAGRASKPPPGMTSRWDELADAFAELVVLVSQRRPLAILVDDVHRADEASLHILCEVAKRCADAPLLLVATEEVAAVFAAGGALERLNRRLGGAAEALDGALEPGKRLRLQALRAEDTAALTRGIFGEVPNVARLARWLHAISLGNAGQNIELASHLVERGHLRYTDGTWLLPESVPGDELPTDLRTGLRRRVEQLSREARELAEALSLLRGASTSEQCRHLHGGGEIAALATMEELTGLGIVLKVDAGYLFARELFRDLLLKGLSESRLRSLHARVAALLTIQLHSTPLQERPESMVDLQLRIALHELHGESEEAGVDRFLSLVNVTPANLSDVALALDVARVALLVMGRRGMDSADLLRVRAYRIELEVAIGGGEYGEGGDASRVVHDLVRSAGLFAVVQRSAGLSAWFNSWVGRALRLLTERVLASRHRGMGPDEARGLLLRIVPLAMVIEIARGRFEAARELGAMVGVGSPGPVHMRSAIVVSCLRSIQGLSRGQFLRAQQQAGEATTLLVADNRSELACHRARGLALFVRGIAEMRCGDRRMFTTCEELEQLADGVPSVLAVTLEMMEAFHRLRGELALAIPYEQRRERLVAVGGGHVGKSLLANSGRGWSAVLAGDLIVLKTCHEAIGRSASAGSGSGVFGKVVRAAYLLYGGNYAESAAVADEVSEELEPWKTPFWIEARAVGCTARLFSGRAAEAEADLLTILDLIEGEVSGQDFGHVAIVLALANCELHSGRGKEALLRLVQLIGVLEVHGSPLLLGRAHERAAHACLAVGDRTRFKFHLKFVRRYFSSSGYPVLLGLAEKLDEAGRHSRGRNSSPVLSDVSTVAGRRQKAANPLSGCESPAKRAEMTLQMLMRRCRAQGAVMYLVQQEGLRFSAASGGAEPRNHYRDAAQVAADSMLEKCSIGRSGAARSVAVSRASEASDCEQIEVRVLSCRREGRLFVVGAVVLVAHIEARSGGGSGGEHWLRPLAEGLLDAGDAQVGPEFQAR